MGILKSWTFLSRRPNLLRPVKSKKRTLDDDVRSCCRKFQSTSKALTVKDKLDSSYPRMQRFIQVLSSRLCEELFFRKDLLFDDDDTEDFNEVVRKALKHVETERGLRTGGFSKTLSLVIKSLESSFSRVVTNKQHDANIQYLRQKHDKRGWALGVNGHDALIDEDTPTSGTIRSFVMLRIMSALLDQNLRRLVILLLTVLSKLRSRLLQHRLKCH